MLLNCVVGEDSWESLGLQGDPTSPFWRTDVVAELQYFGHLMQRVDSLEKTLMLGKTEGRRRKGGQDEMVGWHHQLNGHAFEWTLWAGDGQGALVCSSASSHKESVTTERLNWTEGIVWGYLCKLCPTRKMYTLTPGIAFGALSFSWNCWGRLSYISWLFFGTLHSDGYIFPFFFCL